MLQFCKYFTFFSNHIKIDDLLGVTTYVGVLRRRIWILILYIYIHLQKEKTGFKANKIKFQRLVNNGIDRFVDLIYRKRSIVVVVIPSLVTTKRSQGLVARCLKNYLNAVGLLLRKNVNGFTIECNRYVLKTVFFTNICFFLRKNILQLISI